MSRYEDKAETIFLSGCNCAQAVFGAFAEEYGIDHETAMRLGASLGGGLAHTGQVCGALLGALLALGMEKGYVEGSDPRVKAAHNARVKALVTDFGEKFGATGCADLITIGDRQVCVHYVRYAAEQVRQARRRKD